MSTLFSYLQILGAGYVAVTVVLYILSAAIPAAGFFARLLAAYASLVVCASYGVFMGVALRIFGLGRSTQWAVARAFKYCMWYTTGVTFTVEDPNDYLNTTRPAVFIGNHQTELDVLMLGCIFPKNCSVTAKSSLKRMPFLGWFMSLSYTVFIDRQNSTSARSAMSGAVEEMKRERQSVYMFPEGTRSYSKEPMLLPFKKGAFHLAVQAGMPIVPVVVANYSHVLYVKDRKFVAGAIPVKVLKPIETKNFTASDVEGLARDVRTLMLEEMVSLTANARGEPVAIPAQDLSDGVIKASGKEATASRA